MAAPKKGTDTTEEVKNEESNVGEFVSKEEFSKLEESVSTGFNAIMDLLSKTPEQKVQAKAQDKNVEEASSDIYEESNPRYTAKAKEILGDRLERTYISYPKGGGTMFTIVIARQYSNANPEYLEIMKEDRRTINLEREEFRGEEGVEKWAKLILQNLNRPLK